MLQARLSSKKLECMSLVTLFIKALPQSSISKLIHIFWNMSQKSIYGQLFSEVDHEGALSILSSIKPSILNRVGDREKSGISDVSLDSLDSSLSSGQDSSRVARNTDNATSIIREASLSSNAAALTTSSLNSSRRPSANTTEGLSSGPASNSHTPASSHNTSSHATTSHATTSCHATTISLLTSSLHTTTNSHGMAVTTSAGNSKDPEFNTSNGDIIL